MKLSHKFEIYENTTQVKLLTLIWVGIGGQITLAICFEATFSQPISVISDFFKVSLLFEHFFIETTMTTWNFHTPKLVPKNGQE